MIDFSDRNKVHVHHIISEKHLLIKRVFVLKGDRKRSKEGKREIEKQKTGTALLQVSPRSHLANQSKRTPIVLQLAAFVSLTSSQSLISPAFFAAIRALAPPTSGQVDNWGQEG